jgi:HlyD family secretion protein
MSIDSGTIAVHIDSTELVLKRLQILAQYRAVNAKSGQVLSQIAVQEQQRNNLIVEKNRVKKLLKDGAATTKQLDDINGSIEVIGRQIESIKTQNASVVFEAEALQKQIEQIELAIKKCKVQNPLSGIILSTFVNIGELTLPGKTLYKIADTENMYLRVFLSGKQLSGIKTGQEVTVQVDDTDKAIKKLPGIISWISDQAEFTPKIIQTREERVNLVYAVKIRVTNDGFLRIGMPGELVIKPLK